MFEIDLENKMVGFAIDGISTLLGFASAALVGAIFGPTIASQTGIKKIFLSLGKIGLETIVTYDVSATMKEEIVECVNTYNKTAHEINMGRQAINDNELVMD